MSAVSAKVLEQLLAFRRERNWEQFHTPKNLAIALTVESSELLECFQWASDDELKDIVHRQREAIEDEIADIAILLSYLCHDLHVDLDCAVLSKLEKNKKKYPTHLAFGVASKYDKLK